ncbi:hypothetical protein [Fluviicola taffensis]|uniref:Uncharacterized protein n=1 Tax=Fluviicola taffensis (strain DSM 16823 / NCIMB 13979 / RW262) TaxID=755732 RepID=F2IB16_FLUTR|nr:hypothetical protein [Fluviicola taffensis]AEA42099.1 hypothetical protein Fluta_0089 [Fluviicola taffensis DSM 16823]
MKILNYIALLIIGIVVLSMFLPIYETWAGELKTHLHTGIGIYNIHENGDTGFVVVYNGFGSFYAMFSCLVTLILAIGIFFFPYEISIPITGAVFYSFSLILLLIGLYLGAMASNPFSDRMLTGFYFLLLSQFILLLISVYKLNEKNNIIN